MNPVQEEQGQLRKAIFQAFQSVLANSVINIIGLSLQDDIKAKIRELRNSARK